MDGSQSIVASWDKEDYIYKLYHDSTGSKEIRFSIKADEIKESNNPYLKQKYKSFKMVDELKYKYFKRNPSNHFWNGRPDFYLKFLIKRRIL